MGPRVSTDVNILKEEIANNFQSITGQLSYWYLKILNMGSLEKSLSNKKMLTSSKNLKMKEGGAGHKTIYFLESF